MLGSARRIALDAAKYGLRRSAALLRSWSRRGLGWLGTGPCALLLAACASSGTIDSAATGPTGRAPDAASADAPRAAPKKPVKIVMLLPLSTIGQTGAIAKGLKQAGELALFDRDNPSVQLVVKDDKGTAEGARAAAEEAVKDGAEIILGPLFAASVEATATVVRRANIPVLAFSNDRRVAGNGVYLLSFLIQQEVDRVVSFAARQGLKRFAALVPEDAYGKTAELAFRDAVTRAGGEIVLLEPYGDQANRMLDPARRLVDTARALEDAGKPLEALFLVGGPEALANLGPLLNYASVDTLKVRMIGTGSWDYPNIGREAAFVGGWFPGPDPRGFADFTERFAKTYGSAPPRIASLAYDAVNIAISIAAESRQGDRFSATSLTRQAGFSGVDGTLRFLADGTSERGLAVLEVQKFGVRVIDPAAAAFGVSVESSPPLSRLN